MIIERFLNPHDLKLYRAWKKDVRTTLKLWWKTIWLALKNGGYRRLVDNSFEPIFICGVSGSGTTLLGGLIDQDYECELFISVSDRLFDTHPALWMEHSTYYDDLQEYYDDLVRARAYSKRRMRNAVLGLYRRLVSYPRQSLKVIDKAPNSHMARVEILRKVFPNAKFLLIYRDAVESVEGLKRKWPTPFGASGVEALSNFWTDLHELFLQDTRNVGNDAYVVSYEQLIQDSQLSVRSIAEWAGLTRRAVAREYKNLPNRPGKGLRNVVDGRIEIVKDASQDVRQEITDNEIETIRSITKATFQKLEALKRQAQTAKLSPALEGR